MWEFYAIALPITLGMVVCTLLHYASPKVLQHVRIIVAYAWFVNVSIVILAPVDVWTTLCLDVEGSNATVAQCGSKMAIRVMWSFSYWSAFFLTWAIIPVMQGYEDAGDFTSRDRLRTSIRGNLMLIGIVGGLAVVGITILLATRMHHADFQFSTFWRELVAYAIGVSTSFALVTGALLLGFGLVEIPRGLWRHAELHERKKWLSHRVARTASKLDQAHQELSTAIVIAQATSLQMPRQDPLRPMMEVIDAMANEDPTFKPSGGQIGENDMDYDADMHSMASLRRRLRIAQENYARYKTEYCTVVWEALELEETLRNYNHPQGMRFVSMLRPSRKGHLADVLDTAEWVWRCVLRQHVVRGVSVMLGAMSVAILFAEATLLSQQWDFSLFSVLVKSVGMRGVIIQLVVFVPLVYLCVCTYFSLFKLGMFTFYYLVPHHTNSTSLLMNCSMVSRYAAPMCYNFLSLIHLRQHRAALEPLKTVFETGMGVLPKEFERVFPLCMVVWCGLIASNFHHRIAKVALGSGTGLFGKWRNRFRFEDDDDDDEDGELGSDGTRKVKTSPAGMAILRRERSNLERGLGLAENVLPLARHFSQQELERECDTDEESLVSPAPYNSKLMNGNSVNGGSHDAQHMQEHAAEPVTVGQRLTGLLDRLKQATAARLHGTALGDLLSGGPPHDATALVSSPTAADADADAAAGGSSQAQRQQGQLGHPRSLSQKMLLGPGEDLSLVASTGGVGPRGGQRAPHKWDKSRGGSDSNLLGNMAIAADGGGLVAGGAWPASAAAVAPLSRLGADSVDKGLGLSGLPSSSSRKFGPSLSPGRNGLGGAERWGSSSSPTLLSPRSGHSSGHPVGLQSNQEQQLQQQRQPPGGPGVMETGWGDAVRTRVRDIATGFQLGRLRMMLGSPGDKEMLGVHDERGQASVPVMGSLDGVAGRSASAGGGGGPATLTASGLTSQAENPSLDQIFERLNSRRQRDVLDDDDDDLGLDRDQTYSLLRSGQTGPKLQNQ